jgi:hypothetical protein
MSPSPNESPAHGVDIEADAKAGSTMAPTTTLPHTRSASDFRADDAETGKELPRDIAIQPTPLVISTDDPGGPDEDVIPDGGYGWVIVCCNLACNAGTWGMPLHSSTRCKANG